MDAPERAGHAPVSDTRQTGSMTYRTEAMRREYHRQELVEDQASPDPLQQFRLWFDDARSSGTVEPNAMVVGTVDAECRPSQRTVLLKHFDESGFVFYTNYESRKGRELAANPHVALLLFWPEMERQVRISGIARRLEASSSDAYFAERPRGSQIGSMTSPQSQVVPDRTWLNNRFDEFSASCEDHQLSERLPRCCPVEVEPYEYELWQGRPNRSH